MAMQNNSFSVLFFIKKSKLLKNGEAPICMRITVNSKRAEVQVKRRAQSETLGDCVKILIFAS